MPPQNNAAFSPVKLLKDYKRLRRLINENGAVFCAFDTETTGLSYKKDKIIELGAVRFDKSGVLATYNSFVHVDFPLPPIITQITHITDQMLLDAPNIQKAMADFEEFSKGCVLVAHNAQFDWNFVNAERTALGMKELKNKAIDTLDLARWAYPVNKKYSLQYLAAGMKIDVQAAHRAYDDARVCMEVFLRAVRDTDSIQK